MFAAMFIFMFGLVTFGLGWGLFALWVPGVILWAILYYGFTFGSPTSAGAG